GMSESADGESAASTESRQRCSTCGGLKKGNGASWMLGSRGIAQLGLPPNFNLICGVRARAGVWRCFYHDKNGVKVEEDASIVILKYGIDKIIKEESPSQVEKLKVTLKQYRGISARELVTRSDLEEILEIVALYEELSYASVSYISKLSTYRSLTKEWIKASKRVQLAHARAKLLKNMSSLSHITV
ncbi:hypothetical protein IGI04_002770, partial [Brassica rapa subsp. trilocularis]